ncbi:uncharacterized protein ACOB8E_014608 isoform 1-T2 [Sarcophilus harrisii]
MSRTRVHLGSGCPGGECCLLERPHPAPGLCCHSGGRSAGGAGAACPAGTRLTVVPGVRRTWDREPDNGRHQRPSPSPGPGFPLCKGKGLGLLPGSLRPRGAGRLPGSAVPGPLLCRASPRHAMTGRRVPGGARTAQLIFWSESRPSPGQDSVTLAADAAQGGAAKGSQSGLRSPQIPARGRLTGWESGTQRPRPPPALSAAQSPSRQEAPGGGGRRRAQWVAIGGTDGDARLAKSQNAPGAAANGKLSEGGKVGPAWPESKFPFSEHSGILVTSHKRLIPRSSSPHASCLWRDPCPRRGGGRSSLPLSPGEDTAYLTETESRESKRKHPSSEAAVALPDANPGPGTASSGLSLPPEAEEGLSARRLTAASVPRVSDSRAQRLPQGRRGNDGPLPQRKTPSGPSHARAGTGIQESLPRSRASPRRHIRAVRNPASERQSRKTLARAMAPLLASASFPSRGSFYRTVGPCFS